MEDELEERECRKGFHNTRGHNTVVRYNNNKSLNRGKELLFGKGFFFLTSKDIL